MQIRNVEKLVPDWICKKLEPSGDLLYKYVLFALNIFCKRALFLVLSRKRCSS